MEQLEVNFVGWKSCSGKLVCTKAPWAQGASAFGGPLPPRRASWGRWLWECKVSTFRVSRPDQRY